MKNCGGNYWGIGLKAEVSLRYKTIVQCMGWYYWEKGTIINSAKGQLTETASFAELLKQNGPPQHMVNGRNTTSIQSTYNI